MTITLIYFKKSLIFLSHVRAGRCACHCAFLEFLRVCADCAACDERAPFGLAVIIVSPVRDRDRACCSSMLQLLRVIRPSTGQWMRKDRTNVMAPGWRHFSEGHATSNPRTQLYHSTLRLPNTRRYLSHEPVMLPCRRREWLFLGACVEIWR